tara:strand:- start:532 stop:969 length:438 start_codon:yes stop_codon:yes gene_type:complete
MKNRLMYVTSQPDLWKDTDPIHPDLGVDFKTAPGRSVVGLKGPDGDWKAFMCYARTTGVPKDLKDLETMTDPAGEIVVPYTVWSLQKGFGRQIINAVIDLVQALDSATLRVVTLSPLTEMARKFHTRNGAVEFRKNTETVNFEYY